jgi:hypothetical protein
MTDILISEQNLVKQLRAAFPEIEDRYTEESKSWGKEFPGNYIVFAFVFKPLLKAELAKNENEEFLHRFCTFMERVCVSGDSEAINVIWLKIFKLLLPDPAIIKRLWPLLGAATKANIEDAAARWGLIRNLPVMARPAATRFLFKSHRQG